MKNFSWAVLALLLALGAIWWGLDSWLHNKELATLVAKGKWVSNGHEWGIVAAVWPILGAFGFFVAAIFAILIFLFFREAIDSDYCDEIDKLKESAAKSEKNAQNAREELLKAQSNANANARNHAQLVLDEANEIKQRAEQFYQDTKNAKSAMLKKAEQAEAERDQMAACLLESDAKRLRAESFTIRFKRKALKVQDKLSAYLDARFEWNDKEKSKTEIQQIFEPITKQTDKTMMKPKTDKSPCMELARGLGQRPS